MATVDGVGGGCGGCGCGAVYDPVCYDGWTPIFLNQCWAEIIGEYGTLTRPS